MQTTTEMSRVGKLLLSTSEPDLAQAFMTRSLAPHRLEPSTRSNAMKLLYHRADLNNLSFHRVSYGTPVAVDVPALETSYLLQISLGGHSVFTSNGTSSAFEKANIFVVNPDQPFRKEWSAETHQLTVKIDRAFLERHLATESGSQRLHPIIFEQTQIPFAMASTLIGLIAVICDDLVSPLKMVTLPAISRHMISSVFSLLLNTVPHSRRAQLEVPCSPAAPYYVRRAEEFIRAHASDDIDLHEIAAAAGVSARALSKGFRRFRETTPMSFMKDLRLDLARQKLLGGSAGNRSVTGIAVSCGIHHLSRFAHDYFQRFGELPSETLRRSGQRHN